MSPSFHSGKTMSQTENEYTSDCTTSSEGTPRSGSDSPFEGGVKSLDDALGTVSKRKTTVKKEAKFCAVCHDIAAGTYFGAAVCLPCKSFYIRCTKDEPNPTFVCAYDNKCEINKQTRLRCQSCRFNKCLRAGMRRKEKLDYIQPSDGQELCLVCGDIANGCHFGIYSCEGCKKFYRRGMHEADTYECKADRRCPITPRTRNDCRYCRFQKCLAVGMSRQAIKMGRPKKTSRRRSDSLSHGGGKACVRQKENHFELPHSTTLSPVSKPDIFHLPADDGGALGGQSAIAVPLADANQTSSCEMIQSDELISSTLASLSAVDMPTALTSTMPGDADGKPMAASRAAHVFGAPPKGKEELMVSDLMFTNSGVDLDLDSFIKTLDEQEDAILSAEAERVTDISSREFGEIVHWLKERDTSSSASASQHFSQPSWQPASRRQTDGGADVTMTSPSGDVRREPADADVALQPLKPLSEASVIHSTYADYLARPSDDPTTGRDSLTYPEGDGGVLTANVPRCDGTVILGQPVVLEKSDDDGSGSTASASSSYDVWMRHRIPNGSGDLSSPDYSETVTSSGQVKRRTLDSDLSEASPKMFRMDYWTSQISVEIPQFTDQHHKLLSDLQTAYECFVESVDESKLPTKKNTLNAAEETRNSLKGVRRRIINNLSAAMTFALSVPGFKRVEQSDQFHLVNYGGFHMLLILAGREQYIPEKHTFRYLWNVSIPNNHPAHRLRCDLLDAGRAVFSLKLDQMEAAALGALALTSTDWLQLNFPDRLEAIKQPILDSLLAYVINKHGRVIGRCRVEEMFHLMPSLRELTIRHTRYTENFQLVIDGSDLVQLCECMTLDECP